MIAWTLLFLACTNDPDPEPSDTPEPTGHTGSETALPTGDTGTVVTTGELAFELLELRPPDDPNVFLVMQLEARAAVPTRATLRIDDGETLRRIDFTGTAASHSLPVLGLRAGVPHTLTVTLTADDGRSGEATLQHTPALPAGLLVPDARVVASELARVEPGWTLAGLQAPGIADMAAMFDEQGRLRWGRTAVGDVKAAALGHDGILSYKVGFALTTMDMLGRDRKVYSADDLGPGTILVEVEPFHHDMQRQADGTLWSLVKRDLTVEEYPTDYAFSGVGPAVITDDMMVHLGTDGTLLGSWSSAELLDTSRISWDSLGQSPFGELDWGHVNSVAYDPDDDAILVSYRHQDAVVRFTPAGEVMWILANPDGWSPELEAKRLTPVGDVAWPYHPHAPQLDGEYLTVFDNGNNARTTPYSLTPDPLGDYSRLVQYRIDEVAGTVEEVFSFKVQVGNRALFAPTMGNADRLPLTHNILGTFGTLNAEEDGTNESNGRGDTSVRIIEVDVDSGDVVWDLSLTSTPADSRNGWRCDQATRVPSIYQGIATETVE